MREHPAVRALRRGMPLSRFARALPPAPSNDRLPAHADARTPAGRDALIGWLRSWGCRHLRVEDSARTSAALRSWAGAWVEALPSDSLVHLGLDEIERSGTAYGALAGMPAAFAARPTGLVTVTFGATAASKAMYALRPDSFPPWDAPMRRALALGTGVDAYARYMELCAGGIRALARRAGIDPDDLPAAVGRPGMTAARLVDEYLWLALTRGSR